MACKTVPGTELPHSVFFFSMMPWGFLVQKAVVCSKQRHFRRKVNLSVGSLSRGAQSLETTERTGVSCPPNRFLGGTWGKASPAVLLVTFSQEGNPPERTTNCWLAFPCPLVGTEMQASMVAQCPLPQKRLLSAKKYVAFPVPQRHHWKTGASRPGATYPAVGKKRNILFKHPDFFFSRGGGLGMWHEGKL